MIRGGTRPNVIAEEAYAEVDMRVPTLADAEELVPKILNLQSRTEGVTVKVTGELNRPPYEKSNAGAALFEHAKGLAAELGFDLDDISTGGGSDGNFTAPHTATLDGLGVDGEGAHTHYEQLYISSIEPRARLLHRLYPDAAMRRPSNPDREHMQGQAYRVRARSSAVARATSCAPTRPT